MQDTEVKIYHNPACGTSRNVLAMIRNAGIEPQIIEYLKNPPTRDDLDVLAAQLGGAGHLLRAKEKLAAEMKLNEAGDDALLAAIAAHPILFNRPVVVTTLGAKVCRPSEEVLDILPRPQRGSFTKEDGAQVVDAAGQRVENAK